VEALTCVPAGKQKLIHKGTILKGDEQLSQLKEGASLLVMGTPEGEGIRPPQEQVRFL
jgi:hypothetical protein